MEKVVLVTVKAQVKGMATMVVEAAVLVLAKWKWR